MIEIIALVILDVIFVLFLGVAYFFVTRRQMRVYAVVEHLAALAQKNLPLNTGLRMISRDVGGYLGARLDYAAQRVEEGRPLGEALDTCRGSLPALVRNMVRLGERCGNLAGFLEELARGYRRIVEFHHRSVYAFIYPVVLSLAIFLMTQAVLAMIAPRFRIICQQLRLPWPETPLAFVQWGSQGVLAASIALIAIVHLGGSSVYFGRSLFRWLKPVADPLALAVPVARRQIVNSSMQQFTFSLGMMLRRGAALPEALDAAMELELNGVVRRRLEKIARGVREGGRLSDLVRSVGVPGELEWFAEAGEASGALGDNLLQAASFYETRAAYAAHLATRAIVPVFVVMNGAVMFAMWYFVFSPIWGSFLRTLSGSGPV